MRMVWEEGRWRVVLAKRIATDVVVLKATLADQQRGIVNPDYRSLTIG